MGMVIFIGYLSHLLIDMMTKSGIELFWPIRTRVGWLPKFFRVKTGGLLDNVLLIAGAGGVIFFLFTTLEKYFLTI